MDPKYTDEYIEILSRKWKDGKLTEEERQIFEEWYNSHDDKNLLLPYGYASSPLEIRDRMHMAIKEHIKISNSPGNQHFQIPAIWQKIIAAASILLIAGMFVYNYYLTNSVTKQPISEIAINVSPGTDKAVLTLADGRRIAIGRANFDLTINQGNAQVSKTGEGELTYTVSAGASNDKPIMNVIETPRGGKFQVKLPDGTQVWLNAASSLQYPVPFTGNERKVILTGEAYFDVTHNKRMPFVVTTIGQEVKVLGTKFNINSYTDEGRTVTTLEQGSVQVNKGAEYKFIRPGEQTVVSANKHIAVQEANLQTALAWKNNKMSFEDAGIEEIMRQVSRWYDVGIEYKGGIPTDTYSGTINRQSDLSAVLKMFEASDIKFNLVEHSNRKTLIIKP